MQRRCRRSDVPGRGRLLRINGNLLHPTARRRADRRRRKRSAVGLHRNRNGVAAVTPSRWGEGSTVKGPRLLVCASVALTATLGTKQDAVASGLPIGTHHGGHHSSHRSGYGRYGGYRQLGYWHYGHRDHGYRRYRAPYYGYGSSRRLYGGYAPGGPTAHG